jgi:hypothetical protein
MIASKVGAQQAAPDLGKMSNSLWSVAAFRRFYDVNNSMLVPCAIDFLPSTRSGRGLSQAFLTFRLRAHQPQ